MGIKNEIALLAVKALKDGGGGTGTDNYNNLSNKPSINGTVLQGNRSLDDLGIESIQVSTLPTASATNVGKIYQYVGATTENLTNGYFYECVSDGELTPTYSWEQKDVQEAGGGDSSLTENVTSNIAVGAIASGTTLNEGTTFTEFVQKLLVSEIAPTISFSISKSGNVAYGSSYTETLTVNVTDMGTAKSIDTIAWYEGSTLKQTDTIESTTTGTWTYTMPTATTDTTTFKAVVTYKKSNDAQTSVTKTATISFYYNKFYGSVDSLTPSEADVEALTTALGTAKGGTYSFTINNARIAYAYPSSLGALTSIKDGNGFSLFDSFTQTTQSYTQNGTTVSYYLYVLNDPTTVNAYTVVFA